MYEVQFDTKAIEVLNKTEQQLKKRESEGEFPQDDSLMVLKFFFIDSLH